MAHLVYHPLDITIEPHASAYRVHMASPLAGEDDADLTLSLTAQDRRAFSSLLGTPRDLEDDTPSTPPVSVTDLGGRLYTALFGGKLGTFFARCQDAAARQGARLRLRLRLNRAPDLATLPWEYLYNPIGRRYLALSQASSIVRYPEIAEAIPSLLVQSPLNILVMISDPHDVAPLNVADEQARLEAALKPLDANGKVRLDITDTATLEELRQRLRQGQYHIFHFIGHGSFDPSNQRGALIMEDTANKKRLVDADTIGQYLHNHPSLRLVVLNACRGGQASTTDTFSSTAQTLILQGIPAVVAMQVAISDTAAIAFAQEFYKALADGAPLDAAMTDARLAIQDAANNREWGTPVLYMRASDGYLFDIQAQPTRPSASTTTPPPTTTSTSGESPVSADDKYAGLAPRIRMRQMINDLFNLAEFKLLCDDLGVDYEELEGDNKPVKVLSLIQYCQRRRRVTDLINACQRYHPDLTWPNASDIT